MNGTKSSLEHELEQSRDSLKFAIQSAGMGTWDIDLVNDTVQCSAEMLSLWGVMQKDFHGERAVLQQKVHPEDLEPMRAAINEAVRKNSIYEFEYRIYPEPGVERWVKSRGRCTYSPTSPTTPVRFSGVVFDITDRKVKEAQLEAALKDRELFLTIASHELRTPLTCLQLQLHVLETELKEKHSQVYTSSMISGGIQRQRAQLGRLSRIIDNIFEQSKISGGRFQLHRQKFDLVQLTAEVIERSTDDCEINFIKNAEVIFGEWDKFRIEQVINNLISNAIHFGMKRAIFIEIGLEAEEAFIIVRDQGGGIKREDQTRIFEQFSAASTSLENGGIGIGLYLSNNIVQSHGGKIQLTSRPYEGSEFKVVLPIKSLDFESNKEHVSVNDALQKQEDDRNLR